MLIIIPLLLFLPFSYAIASFWPGNYTARTLLLVRQTTSTNPLSKDQTSPTPLLNERIDGLRALLFSDHVLSNVVDDQVDAAIGENQKRLRIQELRRSLWLEPIGNEFLQITYTGKMAPGLGSKLETVLIRFTEALTRQGGRNVGDLLLERRASELNDAKAVVDQLSAQRDAAPSAQRTELDQKLSNAIVKHEAAQNVYDEYHRKLGNSAPISGVDLVNSASNMIVIDPPRDPQFPSMSKLYKFAIVYGAGMLFAIGLVFFAEITDPYVRDRRAISNVTGLRFVATVGTIEQMGDGKS
ncbi:hypothetical protein J1C56_27565 [Aminobacter anthyllidis]|uniref:Polysaccharide chain length determinant N-terminal domain-containing protein n=1 Tax=Aminobacter anthyllidis TaxID=1035067 RepID=A0A9X1AG96_9HYPH|nr:hypothetical protein [Aminobacter anthyllidis]MBT1159335.1 hypothetical protein [Aminobacter anthyllidis]